MYSDEDLHLTTLLSHRFKNVTYFGAIHNELLSCLQLIK